MSGTPFANLRGNGMAGTRTISDEKMEQVRELLFGEFEKQTEARVTKLEARVRELEVSMHRRLDAMQARLDAMSAEADATQRTAFEELSAGVRDLSDRIKRVAENG